MPVQAPFHIIQLGRVQEVNGEPYITLDEMPGRAVDGYKITDEYVELLSSLDFSDAGRIFTDSEWDLMEHMESLGMVYFLAVPETLEEIVVVPVLRQNFDVAAHYEDEYRLRGLDNNEEVIVDDLVPYALPFVDGQNSLGEVFQRIADSLRSTDEGQQMIADYEGNNGESFEAYLANLALVSAQDLVAAGFITLEKP